MQHIFIINPISGKNKGVEVSKVIDNYCKELNVNYRIIYTKKDLRADEIASEYKNQEGTIVYSVGGDGTLNEVVNGIANSQVNLSIIPSGTGNDFYKSLKNFDGDKIDLCKVNDKYFINIASIGLDAEVAELANILKEKNVKGSYYLSLLKTFFTYRPKMINIGEVEKKITLFTVCNGMYYGGGFKIDPLAKIDSGVFDIVEAKDMNKFQILGVLSKLSSGKHLESPNIKFYSTDSISITSSVPLICNVDGEIIKESKLDFSIIGKGINYSNDILGINKKLKEKKLIK